MPENLAVELVPRNRAIYQGRHVRIIIVAGDELISTQRPDTLTQTELSPTTQLLQSGGGPYIIDSTMRTLFYGVSSHTTP